MTATIAQVRAPSGAFSALRHANFRLYFAGQLASTSGTWMQTVAQGFLVFKITNSTVWLGIVACAAGLPFLFLAPFAGLIVESVPRRRLMLFTQTAQMMLAFILSALAFAEAVQVWHIVVLALLLGITNTIDAPARLSFVMELVGREDLPSGIALNAILNNGSRLLGPAAAGIVLRQVGPAWCFFFNGLSFLAVIVSLLLLQVPFAVERRSGGKPLQQLREGLRFAWRDQTIKPLLLMAANIGFFAFPIITILPGFAALVLDSPIDGYAAVSVGQGLGSVMAAATIGWVTHRFRRGRLIAGGVVLAGTLTFLLSHSPTIPIAVLFAALSGWFVVTTMVNVNTLLQTSVPNHLRGRILSLFSLSLLGLSPFGSLLLGGIAGQIGTADAMGLYSLLLGALGALILMRWPDIAGKP